MPESLGRYRPVAVLGAGGMGRVFLALDPYGRTVAVKQLHPALTHDRDIRERLRREVAAMHEVRSTRVAEILDADLNAAIPFVVTRYVQGKTLEDVVTAGGPLGRSALLRVAGGMAEALAAIHDAGHVHRDLKPANVMLASGEPVVIDFGIAQAQDATRITRAGGLIGTADHLAPEVVGGMPAGPPADVFSWATTLAYAATGRRAFGDGPAPAILYRTVHGEADLEGVPGDLRSLLVAALSQDPGARPDAHELIRRIVESSHARPMPDETEGPRRDPTVSGGPSKSGTNTPALAGPHRPEEPAGPAHTAHDRPTGRKRTRMAVSIGTATVLVLASAILLFRHELSGGGRGERRAPVATTTQPAAPQVPVYSEEIGSFEPAVRFREFLNDHVKQQVRITSRLSGEIAPKTPHGRYDNFGSNKDPYLFLWGHCMDPLESGEVPTLDKCDAIQVTIAGKEKTGRPGLGWVHHLYNLTGNFTVDGGGGYQGVQAFVLTPVE